ncbi:MAG: Ig-like domain-containing protein, partial [Chloroflexi bacterium]|nr:Ig-like domain-containing protein [Chloroflexota bacterium]
MRARVFSLLCIVGCAFIAGCQAPRETTKPSITIVAPPQGSSYVAGESVSVHSAVADPSGIARVELYADGAIVAQDAPPVPKQQQLQVIQQWKATGAGQHTLLVRAYNLANATSESGIVINVTAPAAVASPTTVAVAVISPTVPLATIAAPTGANAVALTSIPSTPVPPTPIPPTPIPSTPIPPTAAPQPTAFVIDLPPFDGGQNVSIIAEGTGVRIQAGYSVLENTQ